VSILLMQNLIEAILCSSGWQESRGMMVSVVVGFLNISNVSWLSVLVIVMTREFSFLSFSCSNVNFKSGVMVLNSL